MPQDRQSHDAVANQRLPHPKYFKIFTSVNCIVHYIEFLLIRKFRNDRKREGLRARLVGDRTGCSLDTYLAFLKFAGIDWVVYLAFYFLWGFFSCLFSLLSAHKYNL